jgi:hypothetical protein
MAVGKDIRLHRQLLAVSSRLACTLSLCKPLQVACQRGHTLVSSAIQCDCRVQMGVTAVLTASPTDVLSHVAIRARSQGVLLATCFDEAQLEALKVDRLRVQGLGCHHLMVFWLVPSLANLLHRCSMAPHNLTVALLAKHVNNMLQ